MGKISLYEEMKKYEVEAENIEDFCHKYHKNFDNYGNEKFSKELKDACLKTYKEDFNKFGYVMIPKGSTKTGLCVTWYGNKQRKRINFVNE